jgi:L-fuculose-phosphate aldolase
MNPTQEVNLRKDIVEIARRLYQAGWIRGADGNVSVRLSGDEILITPTRAAKGFLNSEDLVVIDLEGGLLRGDLEPSLEARFHLATYQQREDVLAVVHAHPPTTIAFTVAGRDIPRGVLPEMELLFPGGVPVIPYETPATQDLADEIAPVIREHDVIVMAHHGTITVGADVFDAWMKIEHLEACMEVFFLAECLGGARKLPQAKIDELGEIRKRVLAAKTLRR